MTTPGIPREALLGSRLALQPSRRALDKILAQRHHKKIVLPILGASTGEGSVADFDKQISTQIEKMLQASYNPVGVAGGYSLKVRHSAWAKTGTTSGIDDLDTKKIATLAAGATATHTSNQQSTGIDITYPNGPDCGAWQIQIDGGAAETITPSSTAGYTSVWSSTTLTRGVHTYKITAVGAAQIGMAYIRDQDETLGIRVPNLCRAGAATTQFVNSNADSTWARLAAMQPDGLLIMLGHNNQGATSVAQMVTDMGTIVDRLAALDTTKPTWCGIIGQHSTDARWQPYHDGLRAFAAGRSNCTFYSFRDYFAANTTDAAASGEFYTDNVHLLSTGHELAALILADQMQLPSRRTW